MTYLLVSLGVWGTFLILSLICRCKELFWMSIFAILFSFAVYMDIKDAPNKPRRSDYGIVVAKEAEPAGMGLNMWNLKFQYMPDRYKLILQMEDGRRKEMSIDAVGYMQTNIGDRVKYKY